MDLLLSRDGFSKGKSRISKLSSRVALSKNKFCTKYYYFYTILSRIGTQNINTSD